MKSYARLSSAHDALYVTYDGDDSRMSTRSSYTLVLSANILRRSFPYSRLDSKVRWSCGPQVYPTPHPGKDHDIRPSIMPDVVHVTFSTCPFCPFISSRPLLLNRRAGAVEVPRPSFPAYHSHDVSISRCFERMKFEVLGNGTRAMDSITLRMQPLRCLGNGEWFPPLSVNGLV
jgi:hypothetical protein